MKRTLTALLLTLLTTSTALAQSFRPFTNNQGKRIMASVVSFDGSQVVLRTPDRKQYSLPVSTLSPQDQLFLGRQGGQSPMPTQPGRGAFQPMPNPTAPAPAPASGGSSGSSVNLGGMALAPDWMPQRVETKRELLEGIVFYCKQVLGDTPAGQEKAPSQLSPGITWLMPFDQALAQMPGRVIKMGERAVNNNCFPANSLTISSFQFKSFQDQGKPFNLLHLLLDLKRQVVGVEFVLQTPGKTPYVTEGKLEPYYNFFTLTNNASTRKEVVYAILPGSSSGAKCIQTVFRDLDNNLANGLPQIPGMPGGGNGLRPGMVNPITPGASPQLVKVYEIVHWYLAEPLARCLLDIAEYNGVKAP